MATASIRPVSSRGCRDTVPHPDSVILTEKLGSGTYATVYKGISKITKEVVAVKCIERARLTTSSAENLFTEIKVMKQLKHKHIVRLLDFEWNSVHIFLIMEFCGGGDLSNFVHSRQLLKESTARRFLRQLALALQFLRSNGISHMDLKPQNLLLSSPMKPVLKIGDFGMAQLMRAEDHAKSFRGSPLYMAPEIMLGQPYDAKVDLWSVGIILYETIFGAAPFASETIEELQLKVIDGRPIQIPSTPEISKDCRNLLENLLKRDPSERISFEDFFKHPYIDLEHMPSPDSLTKARELVRQAVVKDSDGKISSAINYYCQAIDYFLPALEYEENPVVKESLRDMIEQYVKRAEMLKSLMKSRRPSMRNSEECNQRLLDQMQEDIPALKEALDLTTRADKLEQQQLYTRALELYKKAVENLLPLIESENGDRKKLLASEVQVYLQRAEELTVLIEKRVPTLNRSSLTSMKSSMTERCPVQ